MFGCWLLDHDAPDYCGKHLHKRDPSTSKVGGKDEFKDKKKYIFLVFFQMEENKLLFF